METDHVSEQDTDRLTAARTAPTNTGSRHPAGIGMWQAALLGISLVIGGHVTGWNAGLRAGMVEYLLAAWVLDSGVLCVVLALAEMTSVLPFSGGLYGFVRVTLGPYLGYLVACSEVLQALSYITVLLLPASHHLLDLLGLPSAYGMLFWSMLLCGCLAMQRSFWRSHTLLISIALTLLLLYFAVTVPCMTCDRSTPSGVRLWFKYLPFASWFFNGIEMLPMACSDTAEPRRTIPRAFLIAFTVVLVNASLLIITAASASTDDAPLSSAYHIRLHMTMQLGRALSVPALLVCSSAWTFVMSKQLRSMAESALCPYPGILKTRSGSLSACVALCFAVCAAAQYSGPLFMEAFSNTGFYATLLIDVILLISFMQFRWKYASLPKLFVSPLGISGAVYGILVLLTVLLTSVILNYLGGVPLVLLLVYLSACTVFYNFFVKARQGFSEEEQKIMFVAYVINANRRSKDKHRRGSLSQTSNETSLRKGFSARSHGSADTSSRGSALALHQATGITHGTSACSTRSRHFAISTSSMVSSSHEDVGTVPDPLDQQMPVMSHMLSTVMDAMESERITSLEVSAPQRERVVSMDDEEEYCKSAAEDMEMVPAQQLTVSAHQEEEQIPVPEPSPSARNHRRRSRHTNTSMKSSKVLPSPSNSSLDNDLDAAVNQMVSLRRRSLQSIPVMEASDSSKFSMKRFLRRSFDNSKQSFREEPMDMPAPSLTAAGRMSSAQMSLRFKSSVKHMVTDVLATIVPDPADFADDFLQTVRTEHPQSGGLRMTDIAEEEVDQLAAGALVRQSSDNSKKTRPVMVNNLFDTG